MRLSATALAIFLSPFAAFAQTQAASTCDFSGIWFNPEVPGDGFNVYETQSGWLIYFLGYDNWGVPFWVTTDLLRLPPLQFNETYGLPLLWQSNVDGITFDAPAPPGEFDPWGSVEVLFKDCNHGTFGLEAMDNWNFGAKSSDVVKLTANQAESGSSCDYSGIWYNPRLPGEGFNLYETPFGWMAYFLGYDNVGTAVWVTSDLFQPLVSQSGVSFEIPMSVGPYSIGAYFEAPLPPSRLEYWGTLQAELESCEQGVITLNAIDKQKFGFKVTNVVKLIDAK